MMYDPYYNMPESLREKIYAWARRSYSSSCFKMARYAIPVPGNFVARCYPD